MLGPSQIESVLEDGRKFFAKKFFHNARSCYEQILELDPNHCEALNSYALTLVEIADGEWTEEAVSYLFRALRADPANAQAWNNLGKFYYLSGESDRAIRALEKARKNARFSPVVLANLACAYRMNQKFSPAFDLLKRAIEVDPRSPWLKFQLGLTHLLKGVTTNSLLEVERARTTFAEIKAMNMEFEALPVPGWYRMVEACLMIPLNVLTAKELLVQLMPEHSPYPGRPLFATGERTPEAPSTQTVH